jgi:molybdopterin biosynthesis enzyme MoaB
MKVSDKMASNGKTNTTSNDVHEVVLNGVLKVVNTNKSDTWSGTMTDLSSALGRVLGRKEATVLPGSPGALRMVLNRVINRLRNRSIGVKFVRTTDHSRTRLVKFAR